MSDKNTPPQVPNLTTPVPQRSDMENFDVRADVLLTELPVTIEMFNTAIVWLDENFLTLESIEAVRDEVADLRDQTQGIADTFDTDIAEQIDIAKDYAIASQTAADIALTTVGLEATGGEDVKRMFNPTGSYKDFVAPFSDETWLHCDGSAYLIDEYPELFERVGFTYSGPDNVEPEERPAALPYNEMQEVHVSPDGTLLVLWGSTTPRLRFFKIDDGVISPIPSNFTQPEAPSLRERVYITSANTAIIKGKGYTEVDGEMVSLSDELHHSEIAKNIIESNGVIFSTYIHGSGSSLVAEVVERDPKTLEANRRYSPGGLGSTDLLVAVNPITVVYGTETHATYRYVKMLIDGEWTQVDDARPRTIGTETQVVASNLLIRSTKSGYSDVIVPPPTSYFYHISNPGTEDVMIVEVPMIIRTKINPGYSTLRYAYEPAGGSLALIVGSGIDRILVYLKRTSDPVEGYPPVYTEVPFDFEFDADEVPTGVAFSRQGLIVSTNKHPFFRLFYEDINERTEFRVPNNPGRKPVYRHIKT